MVIFQLQQSDNFAVIPLLRNTKLLTGAVLPAESNIQRGHPYLQPHREKEREATEGEQGTECEQKTRKSDVSEARKQHSTGRVKQREIKRKLCKRYLDQ